MNTGIFLENIQKDYRREDFFDALNTASGMGVKNIQMFMGGQVVNPDMPLSDKKLVKETLQEKGIKLVAFASCRGHKHFYFPEDNRDVIEMTKRDMELAKEFGVNVFTGHFGAIYLDKTSPFYKNYLKTYKELADFAGSLDMNICIETGPDKTQDLKDFLDEVGSKGSGVNFDSANITMVQNERAEDGVYLLKSYVKAVHAKDGEFIKPSNPYAVYIPEIVDIPRQERGHYQQLPIGQGQVNFEKFIKALNDVGFDGTLIVEREGGPDPKGDMISGLSIIENILKNI